MLYIFCIEEQNNNKNVLFIVYKQGGLYNGIGGNGDYSLQVPINNTMQLVGCTSLLCIAFGFSLLLRLAQ